MSDKGGRTRRHPVYGLATTKCVVCGGEAVSFTGHIARRGKTVIAGWCRDHQGTKLNRTGCYGHVCRVTHGGNLRPLEASPSARMRQGGEG